MCQFVTSPLVSFFGTNEYVYLYIAVFNDWRIVH
jgi:hypothetical protein